MTILIVILNFQVVELICNLCVDYGIHDLTLWENALGRLLHFHAVGILILCFFPLLIRLLIILVCFVIV